MAICGHDTGQGGRLKDHLSEHLRAAERGAEVIVTKSLTGPSPGRAVRGVGDPGVVASARRELCRDP
ncbi:MAG: hypothetical protein R3C32_02895 [Chloroflexota bacterium]